MDEDVQTEDGSIPRDFGRMETEPGATIWQSELGEILRKTIQGLPPDSHRVYAARRGEPVDRRDGGGTGLERTGVKSRLLRARLQLRERLSRYFRQTKEGAKP